MAEDADRFLDDHGGNMAQFCRVSGRSPEEILDFSVNVNPEGMPEFLRGAIIRCMETADAYPEPYAESAIQAAAEFHRISPEMIVFANGTNQIIHSLPSALGIRKANIFCPAFVEYEKACRAAAVDCLRIHGERVNNFLPEIEKLPGDDDDGLAVFLANPGNPAGSAISPSLIIKEAKRRKDFLFIVDEAFIEYSAPDFALPPADIPANMIILRSMTKFYGIAGLRLGYAIACPDLIGRIRRALPEWSLNSFAIRAAIEIFKNGETFRRRTYEANRSRRANFAGLLSEIGEVKIYKSETNYFLAETALPSDDICMRLLSRHGIAVRNCSNFHGLEKSSFIRFAVRMESENEMLARALAQELGRSSKRVSIAVKKRKPSLMIQGTGSGVGKSILVSAFCRILLDLGHRVAPFKSQNMALNSYVTLDGGEIGRAQAVQAQACKIEPDPRMNPILLKPNSDTGAQVIVMGKSVSNMGVPEYFRFKEGAFKTVSDAYESLENDFDAIVLEGAGSPGEINLKGGDIVNMRMAQFAESPVLLAGDIDSGGVYASFLGTFCTFEKWEKRLLCGFLVNKFRGDPSLLAPAHNYIENFTGKPVLGVVPFIRDIALPEEDSARIPFDDLSDKDSKTIDAALIMLGRTSNFTDFAPLAIEPDMHVRPVRSASEFGSPDIVIIPGSKSVIGDLRLLRENGLADKILGSARTGAWVIGICGGLQICGNRIEDPHGIESDTKSAKGLGLIAINTVLAREKTLLRLENAKTCLGLDASGYEIHHGLSHAEQDLELAMWRPDGTPIGFAHGKVWTSYLHGLFDDDAFRRKFIDMLRTSLGMPATGEIRKCYSTEAAINRTAKIVRENVDIEFILKKMGLL